jgi:hypothetical protein
MRERLPTSTTNSMLNLVKIRAAEAEDPDAQHNFRGGNRDGLLPPRRSLQLARLHREAIEGGNKV